MRNDAFDLKWKSMIALAAIAIFFAALAQRQSEKIDSLKAQLAAKPKIIEVEKIIYRDRVVKGPERIVTKTIVQPGGERVIEKIVERDPIIIETVVEKEREHTETPICPAPARIPRWIVGASVNPQTGRNGAELPILRGGVSLAGRLDLSYARDFEHSRHLLEAGWRF